MRKLLLSPIAAACLLGVSGSAFAWEEFSITHGALKTVAEWNNGTIFDISSGSIAVPTPHDYLAGQFAVTVAGTNSSHSGGGGSLLNGSSFYTYCVELTQNLASPTDLAMNYTLVASTAQVTLAKLDILGKLLTVAAPPVLTAGVTSDQAAAFQAAVWEVVYETSSTYDLTGGNITFKPGTVTQAEMDTANGWFASLPTTSLYSVQVLHSGTNQDYMFITAVPEPEAYGLALAGLGVVLVLGRRRQRPSA